MPGMKILRLTTTLLLLGAGVFSSSMRAAEPARPPVARAATPKPDKDAKHRQAATEFFAGPIPRLKIELPFTKDFLAAFYKNTDGDIYDGGFCAEVNENTERIRAIRTTRPPSRS